VRTQGSRRPAAATRGGHGWHVQRPHVPRGVRVDFARVGLTAAVVWAAVALYLSIVPSYAGELLHTRDLALLAAVSALALAASCVSQIVARRHTSLPRAQPLGLGVLALGLAALVVSSPLHSLTVLLAGAVLAGAGHGLGFLDAQQELNRLAPEERRGEVTAAFIACIYAVVGGSVVAAGLLDLHFSLAVSVGTVAVVLAGTAVGTAVWQLR